MVEYSKVNVKLSYMELKKLKNAVKDKAGTTLSLKKFSGNDLPHELLLSTRQKVKLRNAFNSNISAGLKLSRAQISKIIQSGGFFGSLAGPFMKVPIPLAIIVLAPLGITAAASAIDTRFWNNNFNNFKRRNEQHKEICSSS